MCGLESGGLESGGVKSGGLMSDEPGSEAHVRSEGHDLVISQVSPHDPRPIFGRRAVRATDGATHRAASSGAPGSPAARRTTALPIPSREVEFVPGRGAGRRENVRAL